MANKINFITGETYTLAELFSGERKIIIPDLQRDYCWGDENNTKSTGEKGELVTDFVNNLINQFEEYRSHNDKGILNLGLFYGYEVPADHIQLCDGQQRLTTLYLLLGMINKGTGKFRQHLISDYEYKNDDREPYLNYAIRESSLYFLSDLVCKFFINNKSKSESIKKADWYFDYYNLDPSIQSILKALAKIEKILEEQNVPYLLMFGDWLLNKVTFLYFDMENRKNGEETFVVINTTGESLSSTQNLKPLVIQEKNAIFDNTSFSIEKGTDTKKIDQCWEDIETWFWRKRQGENDTADAGFAEFLRWISIVEQINIEAPEEDKNANISKLIQLILQGKKCDFPYKKISFNTIYDYWKALVWLVDYSTIPFPKDYFSPSVNRDVNNRNSIGQNDCFVLLPVLKYVYQNISNNVIPNQEKQKNVKRIYEFFKNVLRKNNVSKAVNSLVGDAIKIIDLICNGDLIDLVNQNVDTSGISKQILTEEEIRKLEILSNHSQRDDVEKAFWNAQEHKIWSGEILPMIEWATDNSGNFQLDKFIKYKNKFNNVFAGECDSNIDNVRRALLTRELKGYPRIFRGYTNYSFGWEWTDWQVLINDNKEHFKEFFDNLRKISLKDMIKDYSDQTNEFYPFVKHPELLSYCERKNIQKWDKSYCLVRQTNSTTYLELKTLCLYLDLIPSGHEVKIALEKKDGIDCRGWKMWLWQWGASALVFEKDWNGLSVAIDIHYNRKHQNDWDIQLFLRPGEGDSKIDLQKVADSNNLTWNGERYEIYNLSETEVKEYIDKLLNSF